MRCMIQIQSPKRSYVLLIMTEAFITLAQCMSVYVLLSAAVSHSEY